MVNTEFIDDIRVQLQGKGYTLGERLGANTDAQTFTFLADFTTSSVSEKRIVKLKSLLTVSAGENGLEKRLAQERREIDILEEVHHPRIPAVREHLTIQYKGVLQVDVLALQYLKMPNLGQRMQQGALLSEMEAVALLRDSLDALMHVHAKGIYHRDIKPSNLLFDGKVAYLIDFNFSKIGSEGSSTVINTYGYYPVDSYSGNILPSQDLVALGNTVIAAAFGREVAEIRRTQKRVDVTDPVDVSALRYSPKFKTFLRKLTAPTPALRYQTASQALEDLTNLATLSESDLEARLTTIQRDKRVNAILADVKKDDPYFEYNVPVKFLSDATDDELLRHLEKVYSEEEFRISDPEYVKKYAKQADRVLKNGTSTIYTYHIKKGAKGEVVEKKGNLSSVSFDGLKRYIVVQDHLLNTLKEEGWFRKERVQYLGEEPCVGEIIYQIPHGAEGIIGGLTKNGAHVLWENQGGLVQNLPYSSGYQDEGGTIVYTHQLTFNYMNFFAGLILVVANPVNYKALYERHFGEEKK